MHLYPFLVSPTQTRHLSLSPLKTHTLLLLCLQLLSLYLSLSPMENRFKLKLSRMFRGSFGSCRSRNVSDVVEKNISTPESNPHSFHMIEPTSPSKARPFPSICRPKCSEPNESIDNSCIISTMDVLLPRSKVSERCSPFAVKADYNGGRTCPPVSPVFPVNPFYQLGDGTNHKQRKKKTVKNNKDKPKKKKMIHLKNRELLPFMSSSSQESINLSGYWWFSSDEDDREDETDTLFSSRSMSSDSSEPRRRHRRSRRKVHRVRRTRASSEVGLVPLQGKVKGSFAVVKKSSDPHNDFRTSMVEMIVEKQIFAAKDLEQLLQCFLSLNSHHHHRVIVEVFTEIWEALFSNWGY